MIVSNLTLLTVFSIGLILFYFVLYFSNSRLNNTDNKVYKILLVVNLISLIMQIVCENIIRYYDTIPLEVSNVIFKADLILILLFITLILVYILSITHSKNSFILSTKIVSCFFIFESILISYLPIHVYQNEIINKYYYFGIAPKLTIYTICFILVFSILLALVNIKRLKFKKFISLTILSLAGLIAIYFQSKYPSYNMIKYVETMFCIVMYFTIENPDIKMLEKIEKAKKEVDDANKSKSEFLASMFHDIRTPLNAILGFSMNLKEEDLPETAKEEVLDIINASESLLDKLNSIVDFSNTQTNNITLYESPYDFKKLFNSLVTSNKTKINSNIEFRYEIASDIPKYLYGDSIKVKQMIQNILSNAIKYTKKGYISFNVRCLNNAGICRLVITIEDSGIGIKKDQLETIFKNVDPSDSTLEGSRLGVTKKIIEYMHGKVIVQSFYGKGSQFMIVLDQKIVDKEDDAIEMPEINKDLSNKTLLIVDDNNLNLKVASRFLKQYNLNIETATSGVECIDLIKNGKVYDLILMDDKMPNKSGVDTLKKLKSDGNFNTPIVVLTANAINGEKEKYLALGFNDFLAKPIERDELNRVIKKYLSK